MATHWNPLPSSKAQFTNREGMNKSIKKRVPAQPDAAGAKCATGRKVHAELRELVHKRDRGQTVIQS